MAHMHEFVVQLSYSAIVLVLDRQPILQGPIDIVSFSAVPTVPGYIPYFVR